LKTEGTRFIIVTHEMGFARKACDRVAYLSDGVICEHGPSNETVANPKTAGLQRFLSKLSQWN
ncbi:MAG: hypothetical protein WAZ15_01360, partial [Propioniciclava sp.]